MKYLPIKILCLIVFGAQIAFAQTESKVIAWQEKPLGSNNERWDSAQLFRILDRVEIESVTVGTPITIGQLFSADQDWLKDIVIRVRNVSDQRFAAIQITMVLPQITPASPDVVYCYGCAEDERAKGIAPGESVEIKMLSNEYYDFVKQRATKVGGIAQINKAELRIMFVTLPDKTQWVSGCIKTIEKKNACPLLAQ